MKFLIVIVSILLMSLVECQVNPEGCGMRLSDFPNKIVGGYKATVGDWGWQIGMNYNSRHLCGGALLNDSFVASCRAASVSKALP